MTDNRVTITMSDGTTREVHPDTIVGTATAKPPRPALSDVERERFWRKVDKSGECWEWTGYVSQYGYGRIKQRRGDVRWYSHAHRAVYIDTHGPVPDDLVIDHLCRNRKCVNPAHLEAVPQKVNAHRGIGPSGVNASKTRCVRGHELSGENVGPRRDNGGRNCRQCSRDRAQAQRDDAAAWRALMDEYEAMGGPSADLADLGDLLASATDDRYGRTT